MAPKTQTHPSTSRSLWLVGPTDSAELIALRRDLEAVGYEVTQLARSEADPTSWQDAPPELVLIDLQQDSAAGIELCSSLRGSSAWSGTAVVMLHDGTNADVISMAREAGATEFLERPFHPALLEYRLNGAIQGALRLLAELPGGAGEEEPCGDLRFASMSAFRRMVESSISRSRGTDNCVAVLAVSTSADADREASQAVGKALSAAVQDFENEGPISHAKGDITLARDAEGVTYLSMPDMGRLQDSARLGYKLQAQLSELSEIASAPGGPKVCVGVSNFPGDSAVAAELCDAARSAADSARLVGDSQLKFHAESTDRWVFERLTLERSLRRAIEQEELVLYYQPKVEAGSRKLVGFEALVRWRHPELGMVSPAQFIPLAEETGLIVPIGAWVLETACAQNKAWQDAGFDPVRMAVNLSPLQFREPRLADEVNETLERTGLAAKYLELEVTESMLMHDIRETIETLRRFKDAGVYLSIDDFGTGYSSLSYLKGFPIDALKIDQSFIRDVTANTDDAAIATSIILMGRSLNLKVIAEGVETENQLAFLQVLQCNEIQGYLISPPVPADEAEVFLSKPGS